MRTITAWVAAWVLVGCSGTSEPSAATDDAMAESETASDAHDAAEDTAIVPGDAATDAVTDAAPDAASEAASDAGPPKTGLFVAVGYGGRRAISTDGVTWTNDVQDVAGGGDDEWLLRDVGYGDGTFVSVGWRIKRAPDAIDWTDEGKMGQWLGGIAWGKGKWVAAGARGRPTARRGTRTTRAVSTARSAP